jgi:threonine dehydrogenase-like Zn-dependent dehydrogenase
MRVEKNTHPQQVPSSPVDVAPAARPKLAQPNAPLPKLEVGTSTQAPGTKREVSLGILAARKAALFVHEQDSLKPGEFRVETLYSGVSAGTESTIIRGIDNYQGKVLDASKRFVPVQAGKATKIEDAKGLKVGERLMVGEGEEATLAAPCFGYMEVGRVVESRTNAVKKGEIVCGTWGHRTGQVLHKSDRFVKLPKDLDAMLGIFVGHMGPICANGILRADATILGREMVKDPQGFMKAHADLDLRNVGQSLAGKRVVVFGAGIVGLFTALMAKRAGADVAVVDLVQERLDKVKGLGMKPVHTSELADTTKLMSWLESQGWKNESGQLGADVAFQCTGVPPALATALDVVLPQSTVVDMGYYTTGAEAVRFGDRFHHGGLNHIAAQIGNIEGVSKKDLCEYTIDLLRDVGQDVKDLLISDVVPIEKGQEIFDRVAEGKLQMQAVFDMQKAEA